MATSRSAAGVAVMDNCIYVVGGYDGNTDLNTVSLVMSIKSLQAEWHFIRNYFETLRSPNFPRLRDMTPD